MNVNSDFKEGGYTAKEAAFFKQSCVISLLALAMKQIETT